MYKPSFSISATMLNHSILIVEKLVKIESLNSLESMNILRRNNKINSIHSTLEIEANSLSLGQVKDILSGHLVIGPQKDIQEVKNAYKAYDMIDQFDGYKEKDLLKAHGILTYLVDEESGKYRNHAEGVKDGDNVIFIAPSEKLVPQLMSDLFKWLKEDDETPLLIKSCIFHYEFLSIHPFGDGNGRTARLWQNVLLNKWNKTFQYVPIETRIKEYQDEYYNSISQSHINGNSNVFIEFMLKVIDESLDEILMVATKEPNSISEQVNRLLNILEFDIPLSANEIMSKLGIKSKETLRATYLNPAIKNGLVKMTIPDKPNSKNQKYYK
ncbi:MAG: Fic family protein [Bacilli bacterium]